MALLSFSGIRHPEPTCSRRATSLLSFQHRPGHSLARLSSVLPGEPPLLFRSAPPGEKKFIRLRGPNKFVSTKHGKTTDSGSSCETTTERLNVTIFCGQKNSIGGSVALTTTSVPTKKGRRRDLHAPEGGSRSNRAATKRLPATRFFPSRSAWHEPICYAPTQALARPRRGGVRRRR
jgi:hypothetical protein